MADEKDEKSFLPELFTHCGERYCDDDDDEYDLILDDGTRYRGPDCLYAIVIEDEIYVDLRDKGELIEDYWEKGWNTRYTGFTRSNFDVYNDRYYKTFPTRYRLKDFNFTKSLRRVLARNADLKTIIRPLRITEAKEKLYFEYNLLRHKKPPGSTLSKSYEYIKYYASSLTELCVFKQDKLVACSIFEIGNTAMVSNMCFWNLNEARRGLGTFTILTEIKYALSKKLDYYYMGFYYKQNPNYQYKTRFSGLELYDWDSHKWVDFKQPNARELLDQKLPRHKD